MIRISKYLSVTFFFSYSQVISCSQLFIFKVNFEESLLPPKYFWVLLHQKYFFREIWNIHWKVFFWNSCFQEIPWKPSVADIIFSIIMSFQYVLYHKQLSRNLTVFSKNAAGGILLITFQRLVVTKGHSYLTKPSTKTWRFIHVCKG